MATTTLTPAASAYQSGPVRLADDDRSQEDRDHVRHQLVRLLLHRGASWRSASGPSWPSPGLQFVTDLDVQRAVHDARHVHDLPVRDPDAGGLRQLRRAAPDRRAGHGVPADQRALALDAAAGRDPAPARVRDRRHRRGRLDRATRRCPRTGRWPPSAPARTCGSSPWSSSGRARSSARSTSSSRSSRCGRPGMTLFRMPIMVWTVLVDLGPRADGHAGHHERPDHAVHRPQLRRRRSSTRANGGDPILYQNIFWFYSHPAVYVMVLPAMGMISEILPVFSRKPLFGYKAFVFATAAIGALGFSVWAHHMFTTGAVYLPFFSLMTFLIAVPTGVKMFNWIFTMWRGQLMLQDAAAVRARLPDDVPHRRHQRRVQRVGAGRLRPPRHVLGRRPPPLRAVRRLGLRDHGRLLLLVPEDDRPDAERDPGQGAVRPDVHRLQPDVLPDARARAWRGCRAASPTTPRPPAGTT